MSQILLSLVASLVVTLPLSAQEHELQRIPTHEVEVSLPGVAVIRDQEQWEVLWRRFERIAWRDGELIRHDIPRVDFDREMLVAVGIGSLSGCSNEARFIERVLDHQHSIVVELGSEETEAARLTCTMVINPIDVVRLDRSEKQVLFRSRWRYRDAPATAPWWDWPTREQLEAMDHEVRGAYLLALARDPRLTHGVLREVASWESYFAGIYLIENPLAHEDPLALIELARVRELEVPARRILFDRHALDLASDRHASADGLRLIIGELRRHRGEDHAELVHALMCNPQVLEHDELVGALMREMQYYPGVIQREC